ncbi:MAG: FG-GAP-like repeat-containing protein [Prevotella sp.]|nr:FG-GAP-like repeat-containing protein [Prevotella sp.]
MKKLYFLITTVLFLCTNNLYAQEEETDTSNPRSINNTGAVGSPAGAFAVTPTGGATYSIAIDLPKAAGGALPQIGLSYNSQAGNGIAGWGCNITGISAITCGTHDIYHDGSAGAIKHDKTDAYYLDGQRLIELERVAGRDSAVFCPEGNPYTRVVLHGLNGSSQNNMWFLVETPDGMRYEYGNGNNGQQYFSDGGTSKVNAWYVTKATTRVGVDITYIYLNHYNTIYPYSIFYSTQNKIEFLYEDRPDVMSYSIGNAMGSMRKRLSGIKSYSLSSGNYSLFREYSLTYDDTSDGTNTKYSRLTSVTEKNDSDEAFNPITFIWNNLSAFSTQASQSSVSLMHSGNFIRFDKFNLITADFNGDGISDIVQHAYGTIPDGQDLYRNYYYIYLSSIQSNGTISYSSIPRQLVLSADIFLGKWKDHVNMPVVTEVDGDGLQDIVIPYMVNDNDHGVKLHYILGKDITSGSVLCYMPCYSLRHSTSNPVYTCDDFDRDGHADIVILETSGASGAYDLHYFKGGVNYVDTEYHTTLSISFDPKKMFSSDFNGDGLSDILVVGNTGYKIFWNTSGNLSANTFSSTSSSTGTSLTNVEMMYLGDFNGDGLADLLTNDKDSSIWYFQLASIDGTFTQSQACDIDAFEISGTNDDDGKFSCHIFDIDGDGKSDAVISKAMFSHHHNLFHSYYEFEKVRTFWMLSNGTGLTQYSAATSNKEDNGWAGYYTVGDFNGDGLTELLHYGYNCYNATNANVSEQLYTFTDSNFSPSKGKILTVTNGFGTETAITYKSLTDNTVYAKGTGSSTFPVATITPAIPVVSSATEGNGAAGNITSSYYYEGLKMHAQGRGLMGMTMTRHSRLGITTESRVNRWHPSTFQPVVTTTTQSDGTDTSTTVTTDSLTQHSGTGQYVLLSRQSASTDFDGNLTSGLTTYNILYGKPVSQVIDYNDNKSIETSYTYGCYGRQYLPTRVEVERINGNNPADVTVTTCTYDSKGLVTTKVENAETSLALTTAYTYDTAGNVLSETTTGSDIETVTNTYQYEYTKRFMTRSVERGYIIKEYTYDKWGNVQTETDKTRSANPLTTNYTYDSWGRLISSKSPLGLITSYSQGWGYTAAKRYYTLTQPTAQPWVKTWYDETGREVLTESVGLKGVSISEQTTYTSKGQVQGKTSTEGNRTVTESYTYDARGRILNSQVTPGASISYAYGNRSVTTTTNGRQYTKTYDSWGNIIEATDPVSSVTYVYGSNGKPSSVTSEGATVTMQYDAAGNQTQLVDPDAGTMTYTYDALGRIKTQTDGNGIVTTNTYNSLGQLTQTMIGTIPTTYSYGQGTTNNGLLLSMSRDGFTESYQYDSYGRVTQETRDYGFEGTRTKTYIYNQFGQDSIRTFPGQLTVKYQYDSFGFPDKILSGTNTLYQVQSYSGTAMTERLGSGMTRSRTFDNLGQLLYSNTLHDDEQGVNIGIQQYTYNYATGNLNTRTVNFSPIETFYYDDLDRLTNRYVTGTGYLDQMEYDDNGNISSRQGVGDYTYGSTRPHAVTQIDNGSQSVGVTSGEHYVEYNELGKPDMIEDFENYLGIAYNYGPDHERWESTDGLYFGDYEERYVNGSTYGFTYLDGGVLCIISPSGAKNFYFIQTDNLGSIIEIVDDSGDQVFAASYDVWGRQDVTINTIGFYRGYTGHEMLNDLGLINMNGRLYDPINARFLSPDNYVQEPWNSQNFNRYSYCLNNPLKFTDPSGEWFGIDDLVVSAIGGVLNFGSNLLQGNIHSFWQGLSLFGVGALAGEAALYSGGAAPYVSSFITSVGNDIVNQGFTKGFGNIDFTQVCMNAGMSLMAATASQYLDGAIGGRISALISSFKIKSPVLNDVLEQTIKGSITGAFFSGGLVAANGGEANESWSALLRGVGTGFVMGAVSGFAEGYLYAYYDGRNPWTGKLNSNKKGSIGVEAAIKEFEQEGGLVLAKEVTVIVDGVRNRFDFVGKKDGVICLYEVKNGPSAHFTKNQTINIPKLQNKQATFIPVGKNALKVEDFIPYVNSRTPFSGQFDVKVRWF